MMSLLRVETLQSKRYTQRFIARSSKPSPLMALCRSHSSSHAPMYTHPQTPLQRNTSLANSAFSLSLNTHKFLHHNTAPATNST